MLERTPDEANGNRNGIQINVDNKSPRFGNIEHFRDSGAYSLLPFRFIRLPDVDGKILLTADTGDYIFVNHSEFADLVAHRLRANTPIYRDLHARHFIVGKNRDAHLGLMAAQIRTRKSFLREGPTLHIFVVTLRCDHSCHYCQVSRRGAHATRFDMSLETMNHAIDRLFEAPARSLTVEIQGGEPALTFPAVQTLVERIEERNIEAQRDIAFSLVSTLHHLTDEMLLFCRHHSIQLSTSLDGPAFIHDANRPNPTRNSHARTTEAIERARAVVGADNVSALTTLTRLSLDYPEAIIDEYVRLGFPSIFLRPLSPYGFAARTARRTAYPTAEFVVFYRRALDYLLQLNHAGTAIEEAYTAILLRHILTPFPTGYMDLRSPAGAGLGTLVYNYDGRVYASDEGRMAAETGDGRFAFGRVDQPYSELMASEAMQWLLASGIAEAIPGCADCAFVPYCGADPIYHASQQGDPIGHRPTSDHCRKHMGLFETIFGYLARGEPETIRTFLAWMTRRAPGEVTRPGYAG